MLPLIALFGFGAGTLVGMVLSYYLGFPPQQMILAAAASGGIIATSSALLFWLTKVPLVAKRLTYADVNNYDLLELVTHDGKAHFIPVKSSDGVIYEPVFKKWRDRLILVTTPDAATPIHGSKVRLLRAIVDHPAVLDPEYIAVVVDFRRKYGFQTLAELFEADRYYGRREELEEILEKVKTELERLERGEGDYAQIDPIERNRLMHDLKRQVEVYERLLRKLPKEKPVVTVRGRVWTGDDVMGWLAYRLPSNALRQIMKLKETEGWLRGSRLGRDIFSRGLLAMALIAIVAIVAMVLLHGGGGGGSVARVVAGGGNTSMMPFTAPHAG